MEKLDTDKQRGLRIAEARKRSPLLTQEGLAALVSDRLGTEISRGAIGNWERGLGLTTKNLMALASALDVKHEWLLTGRGEPSAKSSNKPELQRLSVDDEESLEAKLQELGEIDISTLDLGEISKKVEIPEYDVRASMGDGFVVDRETIKDSWVFSRRYLVDEMRLTLNQLVVIEVVGDSMSPTLESGDRVLVDMADRRIGIPGIFVLWDGDGTVAKRLELVPNSKPQKLMRISDNPHHGRYEVLAEETNIIGRIVWFARRL